MDGTELTDDPIPGVNEYAEELSKASRIQQPGPAKEVRAPAVPMTPLGQELAGRLKEMFHAYTNRSQRNQQSSLGPSEIGTPCDRRLAMSLLRVPRVNPGGDNWASFVGTSIHAGLAEMFMWADAGAGRYSVERALEFPCKLMPRGTGDLLDRTLLMFLDHKAMGRWSLNELKSNGPNRTYRTQVHLYGYGATIAGENIEHVAIVGWPRDASTLQNLYVWTEEYDEQIARDAIDRMNNVHGMITAQREQGLSDLEIAKDFEHDPTSCKFCPYHAPKDPKMTRGCPGG